MEEELFVFPASFAQQRLWFLDQMDPGGSAYTIPAAVRLDGALDLAALRRSLDAIVARHEALRTTFAAIDGIPMQVVSERAALPLPLIDLRAAPADVRETLAVRLARAEARRPFDLAEGPLVRAALLRLAADRHVLLATMHHIISDGWSMGVFIRELTALYLAARDGRPDPLPDLPIQYADFTLWQHERLQGDALDEQLAFWRDQLAGSPPLLDLPTDRPRPPIQTFNGARQSVALPIPLVAALTALSQREDATLFMTLLAAWQTLLHRYSGQDDILVGAPIAGRTRAELEPLIGFFANTLALRADLRGDPAFRALLARVRTATRDAYARQDLPFERLVEALRPARDPGYAPLVQVVFVFQRAPLPPLALPGLDLSILEIASDSAKFDLTLALNEHADGLDGTLEYNTDLFDASTIARLIGHFLALLAGVAADPDRRIGSLPLLRPAERHQVLREWSAGPHAPELGSLLPLPEPRAGVAAYVLDARMEPTPIGVPGELYLGGPGLARADLGRADLTAERFLPNPFAAVGSWQDAVGSMPPAANRRLPTANCRLYRTGEQARWRGDGALDLLDQRGRRAWVAGRRVDLDAAGAALRALPGVADGAMLARATTAGDTALVAYVVPDDRAAPEQLGELLRERMPVALHPDAVVPLARLPLTPDGALDAAALARLPAFDDDMIDRCERRLRESPGVAEAAVVVQDAVAPRPPLHLSDLLPADARAPDPAAPAALDPGPADAEEDAPDPPAFSDGGPLDPPADAPRTLAEALLRTAARFPESGVVHARPDGSARTQTYPALLAAARSILGGLRAAGMRPGDRAILQIGALDQHLPAFWACILGGIAPVTVAVAPSYAERNPIVAKLYNTWELLGRPPIIASDDLIAPLAGLRAFLPTGDLAALAVGELLAHPPDQRVHEADPRDVAFFQLTSGSTGIPKCIQETHHGVIHHILASQQVNAYTPDDVTLNWLPFDHVVPLLMYHVKDVCLGCRQVQAETAAILADPLRWLDLIERYGVTHAWSPNFGYKLLSDRLAHAPDRRWDLARVKAFLNAGEQVTRPVVAEFLRAVAPFGVRPAAMTPAYGMAELCTAMTYVTDFDLAARVGSFAKASLARRLRPVAPDDPAAVDFVEVGPPIPGVQIRIVDQADRVLSERTIGRVQVRGEVVTPGYLDNPAANQAAFVGAGWFYTGDLGFLREGRLTITGREKEVIIINGANYYCYEIEDIVNAIPGVEATYVGVCGIADAATGSEQLAIFFTPAAGLDFAAQAALTTTIRAEAAAGLGLHAAYVVPVPKRDFPKTTSGKIQRGQLKQALEAGQFQGVLKALDLQLANANTLPDWFYRVIWQPKAAPPAHVAGDGVALLLIDDLGLGARLGARLARAGWRCVLVEAGAEFAQIGADRYRVAPSAPGDYARLLADLAADGLVITLAVHMWSYGAPAGAEDGRAAQDRELERGVYSLLFLAQALAERADGRTVDLCVVASRAQAVEADDNVVPARAAALGMLATLPQELPWLRCRHVDLPDDAHASARLLSRELGAAGADREAAYRQGRRRVARLAPADLRGDPRALPFERGGVYLLSGGLGGVGLALARYLRERYDARLLLIGRTPLDDAAGERGAAWQALRRLGADALIYAACDVADLEGLRALAARGRERWGRPLDGVLHLAGEYHERALADETAASLAQTLRPKLAGAWALGRLLRETPEALFIGFSSVNSFFGGRDVGAYAAANRALEAVARQLRRDGARRVYCFAWSMWDDTGISRGYALQALSRARGYAAIGARQGLDSLLAGLAHDQPALLIGLDEARPNVRRWLATTPVQAQQLGAYVAPRDGAAISADQVTASDRFGTPIVCAVRTIAQLPRGSDGALDRRALSAPGDAGRARVADDPRGALERGVAEVWRQLLGGAAIGRDENFFALGGHSLLATQLLARLSERFKVDLPLRAFVAAPTVAGVAERIRAALDAGRRDDAPIPRAARSGDLPLSFAQRRLWFLDQLAPGSAAYTLSGAVRLIGPLDAAALERSMNAIVARHEVLRTTFPSVEGEPVQRIAPDLRIALPLVDLRDQPPERREDEVRRQARSAANTAFDLTRGPLIRAALLRLADAEHILILAMHHIVADGWSLGVLLRETAAFYEAFAAEGRAPDLPDLPIQYADYALWQRGWLGGDLLERQLAYWRRQLGGDQGGPPPLALPADRPRPPIQTVNGARRRLALPRDLHAELTELSRQEHATLFMTLLAAFALLLRFISGQEDLVIGTDVANRTRAEIEPLIGFFVNQLVLRLDLTGDPTFRALLERVRRVTLEAYAHQDAPFDLLVDALKAARDPSRTPLFQVKFTLQNAPLPPLAFAGLALRPLEIDGDTAKFDLLVNLSVVDGDLDGWAEYNTDLFNADRIARMVEQYLALLQTIAAQPDARLSELLAPLGEAETRSRIAKEQDLAQSSAQRLKQIRRRAVSAAGPRDDQS